jgi:hypothetical protein
MCATPRRGVTLPEDVVRREANCAKNERRQAQKQRRWLRSAALMAARARGEETPFEPESLGDDDVEEDRDKEEGEITPLLVFLSHRIICKHTDANCSLHPRVFQCIKSTGKQ